MSRPKNADSKETYERIVAAALDALEETGRPDELSMRKVATRADVSIGTIQYYFTSKSELLEACLDGYYARLNEAAQALIVSANERAGRELIEHSTRSMVRWAWRERALIKLRLSTNAMRGELHPQRQEEFMGMLIRHVAELLKPHVQVEESDARMSIQALTSIIVRLILLSDAEFAALTGEPATNSQEVIEQFLVRAATRLLQPVDA